MNTKKQSANEYVMEFMSDGVYYHMMQKGIMLRNVKTKGGLGNILVILTAVKDGQQMVAFVGGKDYFSVARKLHEQVTKDELVWKEDNYKT